MCYLLINLGPTSAELERSLTWECRPSYIVVLWKSSWINLGPMSVEVEQSLTYGRRAWHIQAGAAFCQWAVCRICLLSCNCVAVNNLFVVLVCDLARNCFWKELLFLSFLKSCGDRICSQLNPVIMPELLILKSLIHSTSQRFEWTCAAAIIVSWMY